MNRKTFAVIGLCLALCLFFAMSIQAAEVTLAWDANTGTITGYRIYARTGNAYDYSNPLWEGGDTTATVAADDGVETAFVVRAYRILELSGGELESSDSNEVIHSNVAKPESPKNLLIQKLEAAWNWLKSKFRWG